MKITSKVLKSALINYFRFKRLFIVADEVGAATELTKGIADILATDGKHTIEVEIKISKSDFKRDFLKRKYSDSFIRYQSSIDPNKFYYCMPESMYSEEIKEMINDRNSKFGIILFKDSQLKRVSYRGKYFLQKYLYIIKPARFLHKIYNPKIKDDIILRLCSAYANCKAKDAEKDLRS